MPVTCDIAESVGHGRVVLVLHLDDERPEAGDALEVPRPQRDAVLLHRLAIQRCQRHQRVPRPGTNALVKQGKIFDRH